MTVKQSIHPPIRVGDPRQGKPRPSDVVVCMVKVRLDSNADDDKERRLHAASRCRVRRANAEIDLLTLPIGT